MSEKKLLIDSNIIIYHLNKNSVIEDFLIKNIDRCAISRLTYIEVLSFDFESNSEYEVAQELLNLFEVFDTDDKISYQAIKNRKVKKIKLPDNIIASTAQVYNSILVTRNVKDFNNLDLEVLNPFDESN